MHKRPAAATKRPAAGSGRARKRKNEVAEAEVGQAPAAEAAAAGLGDAVAPGVGVMGGDMGLVEELERRIMDEETIRGGTPGAGRPPALEADPARPLLPAPEFPPAPPVAPTVGDSTAAPASHEQTRAYQRRVDELRARLARLRGPAPRVPTRERRSVGEVLAVRAAESSLRTAAGYGPSGEPLTHRREKRRKKRRSSQGHRHGERDRDEKTSSGGESSTDSEDVDFRDANAVREHASKYPGNLYLSLIRQMKEMTDIHQVQRGIRYSAEDMLDGTAVAMPYFRTSFLPGQEKAIGLRNSRELKTWMTCLDMLGRGQLAQLGDIMAQRVRALETAVEEGAWDVARHMELITEDRGCAVPSSMRSAAKAEERASQRLRKPLRDGKPRTE